MEWSPSQYEPQVTMELAARLETAAVRTVTTVIERRQKLASGRRNAAALSAVPSRPAILFSGQIADFGYSINEQYVWDEVIGLKTKSSRLSSSYQLGGWSSGSVRTKTKSSGTPALLGSPASPATQRRRLLFPPDAKR